MLVCSWLTLVKLYTGVTALAFEYPLLQPYLQAGAFDYNYGANFASAGTTASNDTSRNSIFLKFQVTEYVRLKQSAISQKSQFSMSYSIFSLSFLLYNDRS